MGNSFGCSESGKRLVSVARDGDLVEAKMLLEFNPCLAKYSTFGGLNSPLHFAATRGHTEIVALLLENGADVNSRNYCGQTALMHACWHGHWEVVQTLLLFKSNVNAVFSLCRTLIFVISYALRHFHFCALFKFVNKAPDGGITTNSSHGHIEWLLRLCTITTRHSGKRLGSDISLWHVYRFDR
ncbi:hypothetical protein IFM89_031270 [Coptis chinensis]|uniref:Uncharacterized protein n=1 Tax=Coptis chinensis TaxID=261450 RepID=A0A835J2Y1_9MAGN|nr:hypothetical protein IFM89_031270 [Coptis chinensis]